MRSAGNANPCRRWVECVGIADRACYDLQVHAEKTKKDMVATLKLAQPIQVEMAKLVANKPLLGKAFKREQRNILEVLEAMPSEKAFELQAILEKQGLISVRVDSLDRDVELTAEMVKWTRVNKTVQEQKYQPSVIEPAFGIGRIMSAVFEHSFSTRVNDAQRGVLSFRSTIAPIKCSVLPQTNAERDAATQLVRVSVLTSVCPTR